MSQLYALSLGSKHLGFGHVLLLLQQPVHAVRDRGARVLYQSKVFVENDQAVHRFLNNRPRPRQMRCAIHSLSRHASDVGVGEEKIAVRVR